MILDGRGEMGLGMFWRRKRKERSVLIVVEGSEVGGYVGEVG